MEEGFYGAKKVEIKNGRPWDLVTDYDKKVEKIIIDSIKEKYPKHQWVSVTDMLLQTCVKDQRYDETG